MNYFEKPTESHALPQHSKASHFGTGSYFSRWVFFDSVPPASPLILGEGSGRCLSFGPYIFFNYGRAIVFGMDSATAYSCDESLVILPKMKIYCARIIILFMNYKKEPLCISMDSSSSLFLWRTVSRNS